MKDNSTSAFMSQQDREEAIDVAIMMLRNPANRTGTRLAVAMRRHIDACHPFMKPLSQAQAEEAIEQLAYRLSQ